MRHSAKFEKIAAALLTIQSRVRPITRDALNDETETRYSSIVQVLEAVRQPMLDCKLSYTQEASILQVGPWPVASVTTLLMHDSGQWLETVWQLPIGNMSTMQGAAAETFAKRVALGSALGVVSETEDRDSQDQTPEPVIETRLTTLLKAERPKGIGQFFKQVFIADGDQKFLARDAMVARAVPVGLPVLLTLKGYADGEVEIIAARDPEANQ